MKRSYFNARQTTSFNEENCESFGMNETNTEEFEEERDENKRKNRNLSEKKRRDHFNHLINELCAIINYNSIPFNNLLDSQTDSVSTGSKQKTDKSSILRASIAFLKNHSEVLNKTSKQESNEDKEYECDSVVETGSIFSWKPSFLVNEEFIHLMLEALDSFIILIEANTEGKIIYVSETVIPLMGMISTNLIQKLMNESEDKLTIYDLIHNEEKSFVDNFLNSKPINNSSENFSSILLHFKDHDFDSESETYQLVRLIGSFYNINDLNPNLIHSQSEHKCFVGIGRLQTPKFLRELNFQLSNNENEFVSRNSLEWKFLYLDHRASPIIGYLPFEILGTSGYDYYHWNDLDDIVSGHEHLMSTGEGTSCIHRFLTKSQQWIWLRTNYYIAYHHWNSKPEFIVCTHTVVKESDVSNAKINKINDRIDNKNQTNRAMNKEIDNNCGFMSCDTTSVEPRSSATSMSWSSNRDSNPSTDPSTDYLKPSVASVSDQSMYSMTSSQTIDNTSAPSVQTEHNIESPKKHSLLHEFLQQKHQLLENQIKQQQEELRRVTEQLVLVRAVNNQ